MKENHITQSVFTVSLIKKNEIKDTKQTKKQQTNPIEYHLAFLNSFFPDHAAEVYCGKMTALYLSWIQTVTKRVKQRLKSSNARSVFTQTNTTLQANIVLRSPWECFKNKSALYLWRAFILIRYDHLEFTFGNQNENMNITNSFFYNWLGREKKKTTTKHNTLPNRTIAIMERKKVEMES